MQGQAFSLIDEKLKKLQTSENGLNLRFRATGGTYIVESTSLLTQKARAFLLLDAAIHRCIYTYQYAFGVR